MELTLGLVQAAAGDDHFAAVRDLATRGAELVCLQELFAAEYFCRDHDQRHFDLAEAADGPTVTRCRELAAELGVVLVAPFFERRLPGLCHNSAAVIDADGRLAGVYRKAHIPHDPGFFEKYYFAPGDDTPSAFDTRVGRIGVRICWDQWFPEAARLTALQGAEVILYPTAIGWLASEEQAERDRWLDMWRTVQRSHAIANGCFVAAANRTGAEGDTEFWGRSFVCGPEGETLAQAGGGAENLLVTLDRRRIEAARRTWPFLRDRRTDLYGPLTRLGGP